MSFMETRPPRGGGKQRAKKNRFLHSTRGLVISEAQKKAQGGHEEGPAGHKVFVHGIAHNHFLTKQREHKVILHHSPSAGVGRGHGHHRKGYHLSAATRAKISAALKGRRHPHKGHPLSASTKARISASLKAYYAGHPGAASARAKKAAATRAAKHENNFHPTKKK